MEKNYGVIDLSENEMREQNGGGFPMLVIGMFLPRIDRIIDFIDGIKEGYKKATE